MSPNVDYIYTMAEGKIGEHGTYADLMAAHGDFAHFVNENEFGTKESELEKEDAVEDEKEEDAVEDDKDGDAKDANAMEAMKKHNEGVYVGKMGDRFSNVKMLQEPLSVQCVPMAMSDQSVRGSESMMSLFQMSVWKHVVPCFCNIVNASGLVVFRLVRGYSYIIIGDRDYVCYIDPYRTLCYISCARQGDIAVHVLPLACSDCCTAQQQCKWI